MCHLRDRPSEGGIVERPFVRVQAKQDEPLELDEVEVAPIETEPEPEMAEIFDYEQLREDYGC